MTTIRLYFDRFRQKLALIAKHPYFGFVVFGVLLIVLRLLALGGIIPNSLMKSLVVTMIYAIIALGFSLLLGYAGLASLGTAGFVGLGTYFIGHFSGTLGYPFLATILISLLGAIVLGAIVGFISLRIEGMYLAIITLGLSEIMREIFKSFTAFTNGVNGLGFRDFTLFGLEVSEAAVDFIVIFVFILLIIGTLNIIKSPTGRALLAMKNSDSAAQSMGIGLMKYRLLAFTLATIYAVIGGLLYMMDQQFSIPTTWSLDFSLNILAAVVVGGAQSITGIILGTFTIFGLNMTVLKEIAFFRQYPDATWIVSGMLIILITMFYPGGLIRLLLAIKFWLIKIRKKLKRKWSVYRYGEDD
ncbi:MAG: branched-chain amino acid ABC transporter permease [Bacillota bacterium]|nr:branched-chain amino acid ABC transporter permease [Bacillota bacterium]